jgi:hypothetical protein
MSTAILFRNDLLLLVLVFFMAACEKDPQPLTTNSVIKGNVYWYSGGSDDGKFLITTRGPYGSKTFEVPKGDFLIDGLGNGNYRVEFSKEGYGTYIKRDVRLFGYDTVHIYQVELVSKPGDFKMPALVRAYISISDFTDPPIPLLTIETDANNADVDPSLMFFFSSIPDVSWEKYQSYQHGWFHDRFDQTKKVWLIFLDMPRLNNVPIKSGDKVYIKAYACGGDRGYVDPYLGFMVFSTLDKTRASNVIDFTMP